MVRRWISKPIYAKEKRNGQPCCSHTLCAPTHLPLSRPFCWCRTKSKGLMFGSLMLTQLLHTVVLETWFEVSFWLRKSLLQCFFPPNTSEPPSLFFISCSASYVIAPLLYKVPTNSASWYTTNIAAVLPAKFTAINLGLIQPKLGSFCCSLLSSYSFV